MPAAQMGVTCIVPGFALRWLSLYADDGGGFDKGYKIP